MERERLKSQIRDAFDGVKFGAGVGLVQAQGVDDYADTTTLARYRAEDEKDDWSKIQVGHLNQCYSSLSFFDAEGMRFHLPAFLIAYLDDTFRQDIVFALTFADYGNLSKFDLLSKPQRKAVCDFLRYKLRQDGAEFHRPMIEAALAEHWSRTAQE